MILNCIFTCTYTLCQEVKKGWALRPELSEPICCKEPGGPVDTKTSLSTIGPLQTCPDQIAQTEMGLLFGSGIKTHTHNIISIHMKMEKAELCSL